MSTAGELGIKCFPYDRSVRHVRDASRCCSDVMCPDSHYEMFETCHVCQATSSLKPHGSGHETTWKPGRRWVYALVEIEGRLEAKPFCPRHAKEAMLREDELDHDDEIVTDETGDIDEENGVSQNDEAEG